MWQTEILGMSLFRIVHTFILYSFCGFLMECIVLTIEKKRLVTDRGFMKGPFCVIYGFAALLLPTLLRPFSHNLILLFLAGMVLATVLEYLTGIVMLRLFGSFWWDYSNKHFNYRGMLCLESSLGWGLLSVLYFTVLERLTLAYIHLIPVPLGEVIGTIALLYFPADFIFHFVRELRARRAARQAEQALQAETEGLPREEAPEADRQTADTLY